MADFNVSMALRARDEGFSAEAAQSEAELRRLGQTAQGTAPQLDRHTGALRRASTGAGHMRTAARGLGTDIGGFVREVAAGRPVVESFTSSLVLAATRFGIVGAAVGVGVSLFGSLAGELLGATEETQDLADAQDILSGTLADGVRSARELVAAYGVLSTQAQGLERALLSVASTRADLGLREARSAAREVVAEIERIIFVTEQNVEGSLPILAAIQAFKAGADDAGASIVDLVLKTKGLSEELAPRALKLGDALETVRDHARDAARAEATLALLRGDATREQIELLDQAERIRERAAEADRRRREIGIALTRQGREEERAAAEALEARVPLIDRVITATVDLGEQTREAASALRAAEREGTGFARAFATGLVSASREGEGFLGILGEIGERLADLASNRLIDLFAASVGTAIGGVFGGPAAPRTGPGGLLVGGGVTSSGVGHEGGIVGDLARHRLVPTSLFADAERYHGGGMVLRPGEVPIIAQRGERITPAGQAAGPTTIVNVHAPPGSQVEQRQRRGPGGTTIRDIIIKTVGDGAVRGDLDRAMFGRFGIRPSG